MGDFKQTVVRIRKVSKMNELDPSILQRDKDVLDYCLLKHGFRRRDLRYFVIGMDECDGE
jgi:hypothetical protein